MKSVLISIQPKWCELIASGKKTVEVRKTRPRLETPFKVYIYCTSGKEKLWALNEVERAFNPEKIASIVEAKYVGGAYQANGKVIGAFVCDKVTEIKSDAIYSKVFGGFDVRFNFDKYASCLTEEQIFDYLGEGKGYAWHISDLVIYDQPKELREFIVPSNVGCCNEGNCRGCRWFDRGNGFNVEDDCNAPFCTDEYKPLRKATQSWCYVEEVQNG